MVNQHFAIVRRGKLRIAVTKANHSGDEAQAVRIKQTSLFLTQLQLQQNELKLKTQNAQNREKSLKLVTK